MTTRRPPVWLLAISVSCALPAAAQPGAGQLDVDVEPAEIAVGDRVEARLTLVWTGPEPASEPRFPPWQETWGGAEVLAAGEVERLGGEGAQRVYRQALVLTAFTPGEVRLPRITVAVPLAAETVQVANTGDAGFRVTSVLPEDGEDLEPRPAAPPVALAVGGLFPWAAGALAGLGLVAAWLLARRLRTTGAVASPSLLEPFEELLERLRRLDPAVAEPAHTGLSLVLRNYLGRSLRFRGVESTTSEIRLRLGETRVEPAVVRGAVRLLLDCDQVKFARASVDAASTRERLRAARRLAGEIEAGLQPAETAGESAEAAG